MKALGAGIGIIVIAFLLFFLMPFVLTGAHTLQTKVVSQTESGVITTAGTSATVVLTDVAWGSRIGSIGSISGGAGDTPAASSLSVNGKTVVITGLATSATRALVIAYSTDNLTDFPMMSSAITMGLVIIFLAGLGLAIYGGYQSMQHR